MRKKSLVAVFLLALFLLVSLYLPFPRHRLDPAPVVSLRLEDRNGILLREVLSDEGGRCRWITLGDLSPFVLKATVAAEDQNFLFHRGVNLPSVLRAAFQNLRQRKVVSGASTISQQLVRNIYPARRNIITKLREMWLAVRLEHTLSKEHILVQYLNRICYGNQAFGIEAASRLYFDKSSSQLSLAEAAFLAGLPRSPSLLNPYRFFRAAQKRKMSILGRMEDLGFIGKAEMRRAMEEKLILISDKEKFRAAHFCDFILSRIPPRERRRLSVVRTTLDYALQEKLEIMVRKYLESVRDRGIANAALVVLDNASGEILSLVGSGDFFDVAHDGQVNGALALRQPGSALKPFTYALALEKGLTAATRLEDSPAAFGTAMGNYMPQNFDRKYHGPLSLRAALACSYNVPAVSLLDRIGTDILYQRLKAIGFESLNQPSSYYGLGLTLGNGEVSLLELVRAYAVLARQGRFAKEKAILRLQPEDAQTALGPQNSPEWAAFSPQVAYIITHILADKDARIPSFGYHTPLSFPFAVAAKTGTSKDFRDNWTIGFSPRSTVGVWVGNFDGKPMHNVSGITGCGPLFRDAMLLLHKQGGWSGFEKPPDIVEVSVCPVSGDLPAEYCPGGVQEVFIRGTEPCQLCTQHQENEVRPAFAVVAGRESSSQGLEVSFPRNGDIFKIDPVLHGEFQRIKLRATIQEWLGDEKVEWCINGKKIGESPYPYTLFWNLKPGSFTIKARLVSKKQKMESPSVKIIVLT